jgi:hypothetical protein
MERATHRENLERIVLLGQARTPGNDAFLVAIL